MNVALKQFSQEEPNASLGELDLQPTPDNLPVGEVGTSASPARVLQARLEEALIPPIAAIDSDETSAARLLLLVVTAALMGWALVIGALIWWLL